MKHILSARQFTKSELIDLFARTEKLYKIFNSPGGRKKLLERHKGRTLADLFYEPSTRTRLSFETAAHRLGLNTISTENALEFLSAKKGESIEDTAQVLSSYADVIVIRHPENGMAQKAASVNKVSVISAGEGSNEHPTQGLTDLYTIIKEKGKVDGLKIAVIGELLHSRTLHSLVNILAGYDVELYLISPKDLKLPASYTEYLKKRGRKYHVLDSWDKVLGKLDVIYINRVQKERYKKPNKNQTSQFRITTVTLKKLKDDAIIMNPLPRVDEIDPAVDKDPRAAYFRQVENGVYIRMALIDSMLS